MAEKNIFLIQWVGPFNSKEDLKDWELNNVIVFICTFSKERDTRKRNINIIAVPLMTGKTAFPVYLIGYRIETIIYTSLKMSVTIRYPSGLVPSPTEIIPQEKRYYSAKRCLPVKWFNSK